MGFLAYLPIVNKICCLLCHVECNTSVLIAAQLQFGISVVSFKLLFLVLCRVFSDDRRLSFLGPEKGTVAMWGERSNIDGLDDMGAESMEVDAKHCMPAFSLLMWLYPFARARFALVDLWY